MVMITLILGVTANRKHWSKIANALSLAISKIFSEDNFLAKYSAKIEKLYLNGELSWENISNRLISIYQKV